MLKYVVSAYFLVVSSVAMAEIINPSDYSHIAKLNIVGYNGSETLTNFPMLVTLEEGKSPVAPGDFESDDYSDLRFTTADGSNTVPYEVEKWFSPTAAAVMPTNIPGCVLWLKADSGLQTDALSGLVTNWIDSSGNGNNATQTNTLYQPASVTNQINGYPAVRFAGGGSGSSSTNEMVFSTVSAQTVFIVNKPAATIQRYDGILGRPSDLGIRMYSASSWSDPGSGGDFSNLGGSRFYVNGSHTAEFDANTFHVVSVVRPVAADISRLGHYFTSGSGRAYDGDISEVIVYNRRLSLSEIDEIHAYLKAKYALDVSPVDSAAVIWVQVPELTSNTEMYVYWGNTNATTIPAYCTNGSTWDSSYAAVYHLNQAAGGTNAILDSTANGNNGTSVGGTNGYRTVAHNTGYGINFNGSSEYIDLPDLGTGHTRATVEAWIKSDTTAARTRGIVSHKLWKTGTVHFKISGNDLQAHMYSGGLCYDNNSMTIGNWFHVAYTFGGNGLIDLYRNGLVRDEQTGGGTPTIRLDQLMIANEYSDGRYFDGMIDEVRISLAKRSTDWMKAEYNSINFPGAFAHLESILYWDVGSSSGLQPGNGYWSTNSPLWNDSSDGSNPLQVWDDSGRTAYFVPDGTSSVSVDSVSVAGVVVDGTGYSFSGGTINLGAGGFFANENVTVGSAVVLSDNQLWRVAAGKTNLVSGAVSGSGLLSKSGAGQLTLTSGSYPGTVTVNEGTLEVLGRSGDVPYEIMSDGILKLGYSTAGGYANTRMVIHGAGTNSPSGFYLAGGSSYNGSGQIQLRDAPTAIRQYGTGYAKIGQFDINGTAIWCSTPASGSVIDENIKMISRGYGMSVNVDRGSNTAVGDLIINGPLDVGVLGFYKRGYGSIRLNAPATANNKYLKIQYGTAICGVDNCIGANAPVQVSAGATLDVRATSQATKSVQFSPNAVLHVDFNSRTDYGQLVSAGAVTISGTVLDRNLNFAPDSTAKFFVIVNNGTNQVDGTFNGLPAGEFTLGDYNGETHDAIISYDGDFDSGSTTGGNDVVIYFKPSGMLIMVR